MGDIARNERFEIRGTTLLLAMSNLQRFRCTDSRETKALGVLGAVWASLII
jgi:hypothetical protein